MPLSMNSTESGIPKSRVAQTFQLGSQWPRHSCLGVYKFSRRATLAGGFVRGLGVSQQLAKPPHLAGDIAAVLF